MTEKTTTARKAASGRTASGRASKKTSASPAEVWKEGDLKGEKIFLIIERDRNYRDFATSIISETVLGEKSTLAHKEIKSVNRPVGRSLFDSEVPVQRLHIGSKEDLDRNLEILKHSRASVLKRNFSKGLIITTDLTKMQMKKMKEHLLSRGVIVKEPPAQEKGDKQSVAEKILSTTSFSPEIKRQLAQYVGSNYTDLYPVFRNFFTDKKQKEASLEEVMVSIPTPEGTVEVWGLEELLYKGDRQKALELFRRTSEKTLVLTLWYVRNKVAELYKTGLLLTENPGMSKEELAQALGKKAANYGHTLLLRRAKAMDLQVLEEAFEKTLFYDSKIRGYSSFKDTALAEEMLVCLAGIFKRA